MDRILNPVRRPLPFFYGWVIVGVVFVTIGVAVTARTAFSLFFPPLLAEFGWDQSVTAGAFSFGFLVSAALSPVLGRAMDRYGPRVVIEAGVLMLAAGLLLATQVRAPWELYATLGVLVSGGTVCLGYSGQSLFLPNWFVRRRGLAMSIAFSGVGVGAIVLLPWLQALIQRAGWRAACLALGLLVLGLLAPLNLLLRQRPEDLGLAPDGDSVLSHAAASAAGPAANVVDAAWAATDWTLRRALHTARFWWLALGYFCALYVWYAAQVHQTQYLLEVGFSPAVAAWALGFAGLIGIPGQIMLGHLSDRIGREWVWTAGTGRIRAMLRRLPGDGPLARGRTVAVRHGGGAGAAGLRHHLGAGRHSLGDFPGPALWRHLRHADAGRHRRRRRGAIRHRRAARPHRQLPGGVRHRRRGQRRIGTGDLAGGPPPRACRGGTRPAGRVSS